MGVVLLVDDRLLRLRLRPGHNDVIRSGRPGLEKQDEAQSGQQPCCVAAQRDPTKLLIEEFQTPDPTPTKNKK